MQSFYRDCVPTLRTQCSLDDNVYFLQTQNFEIQQTPNQSRYHPYKRRQYPIVPGNSFTNSQYQHHFDSTSQLPAYRDVTPDSNIQTENLYNWNRLSYSYPYLNFLHEESSGANLGIEIHNGTINPHQTHLLNGHIYSDIGQHFSQFQPVGSSKTNVCAGIGQTRTRDKYRVVYTDSQKEALEKEYEKNIFITESRRAELSEEINLSERQIKFWFQNRRVKDRRGKTTKTHKLKENLKTATQKGNNIRHDVTKETQAIAVPKDHLSCRFPDRLAFPHDVNKASIQYNGGSLFENEDIGCQIPQNYNETTPGYEVGYPRSPSEWAALSETSLLTTLNVSPILTSVEGDHLVRS